MREIALHAAVILFVVSIAAGIFFMSFGFPSDVLNGHYARTGDHPENVVEADPN